MVWPGEPGSRRLTVSCSHANRQIVVLDLTGELDSGTLLLLTREIAAVLAREPVLEAVVVDLGAVVAVSAAGLRALYAAQDHAAGKGVVVRVVAGRCSNAGRVLDATNMRAVLDVYSTRAAAVASGDRDRFVREMRGRWARG